MYAFFFLKALDTESRASVEEAPPVVSRQGSLGCVSAELFFPGPRTQMTLLFLAPRSMCRSTPAPPSATGLQHTHELATPMHACEIQ